jgi:hypothetical protein
MFNFQLTHVAFASIVFIGDIFCIQCVFWDLISIKDKQRIDLKGN